MSRIILVCTGLCLLATAATAAPPLELEYTLTLKSVGRGQPKEDINRFRLNCLISDRESGGYQIDSLISEQQAGGWAWPERFGRQQLTAGRTRSSGSAVTLLQRYQDNAYFLALPTVLFDQFARMTKSQQWQQGDQRYSTGRDKQDKGRTLREVRVEGRLGRSHMMEVDVETGLIVRNTQRVFMGRGDEFELQMELVAQRELDAARAEKLQAAFDALLALQKQLARRPSETRPELTGEQVALVKTQLKPIEQLAKGTILSSFVSAIGRDGTEQSMRVQSVEELAKRFVGQAAPDFQLTQLNGQPVPAENLKNQVVVLHFWEYKHEPLEEPYGQIGYLDYLNERRNKAGVKIYGVAVNPRLANQETARSALRSIRKLQEFMNIGYELTLDDGTLLRKFGDPRRIKAQLPLWVVIDPAGKVVMYKAGLFEIQADQGLKELDRILIDEVKKFRAVAN